MKLLSWNVNGVRAVMQKAFTSQLKPLDADVICLQETKAQDAQVLEALSEWCTDYHLYMSSAVRKGYSGTAILSKEKPLSVSYGIGEEAHDMEGRVVCAEYTDYYLINVYVPNSGSELLRLDYRQSWDLAFYTYLKGLERTKPVIVCGDFNVAHRAVDLARPKANYNKAAGFMQEEIDGMDRFVQGGLVDTFRFLHPDKAEAYSWWSYRAGARAKNIGWRIDYFLISQTLTTRLTDAKIHPEVMGSDHCPVSICL